MGDDKEKDKNTQEDLDFIKLERQKHEEMYEMLTEVEKELYDKVEDLKAEIAKAEKENRSTDELKVVLREKEEELNDTMVEMLEHEDLMRRIDEEEE